MLNWKTNPPETSSYSFTKRTPWPVAYLNNILVASISCDLGYTTQRAISGNHPELTLHVINSCKGIGFPVQWIQLETKAKTLAEAKQIINNYFGETL